MIHHQVLLSSNHPRCNFVYFCLGICNIFRLVFQYRNPVSFSQFLKIAYLLYLFYFEGHVLLWVFVVVETVGMYLAEQLRTMDLHWSLSKVTPNGLCMVYPQQKKKRRRNEDKKDPLFIWGNMYLNIDSVLQYKRMPTVLTYSEMNQVCSESLVIVDQLLRSSLGSKSHGLLGK